MRETLTLNSIDEENTNEWKKVPLERDVLQLIVKHVLFHLSGIGHVNCKSFSVLSSLVPGEMSSNPFSVMDSMGGLRDIVYYHVRECADGCKATAAIDLHDAVLLRAWYDEVDGHCLSSADSRLARQLSEFIAEYEEDSDG